MIKGSTIFLLQALLLWGAISCKPTRPKADSQIIAEVGNSMLLKSQLDKVFPLNISSTEDSVQFAREFIDKWIKLQLLVGEAEKSLTNEELNVSQEIEEYRQELLIHKFKNKKFEELNTYQISDDVINKYYEENSRLFVLEYSIVQVNYIIFPQEIELTANFRKQLTSNKEDDMIECEDFIFKFAKKYDDFNNDWIYFQQFKELGQLQIEDESKFLDKNNIIEFNKDSELHVIYVKAYMIPGEQAPVEFVKSRITSLIINQKKLDFLRQFKDSLYNAALKYNKFRVYNQ